MNQRIQELALQARLGPALMLHYWKNIDALTDSEQAELEQLEKFAELIVQECADKCLEMAYVNPGPHHYAAMLKENFGVES